MSRTPQDEGIKRWWPSFVRLSVCHVPDPKSRTEGRRKLKIGGKEAMIRVTRDLIYRWKVKGQGNKVTSQNSLSFAAKPTAMVASPDEWVYKYRRKVSKFTLIRCTDMYFPLHSNILSSF